MAVFKILSGEKNTTDVVKNLQNLSYKICSIAKSNFAPFGLFAPLLDETDCC